MNKRYQGLIELLFFCIIILFDRLTKHYALSCLDVPCTITKNLSFVLLFNRGISWGFFHSDTTIMFVLVSCLIIALIGALACYTLLRWLNRYSIIGELMVLAGAVSNIIDRFIYKGVVDFILISGSGWTWPVFNIADFFIVIGVGIMFLSGLRES